MSFNNDTMYRSNGLKHVANLYRIIRDEVEMATIGLIADGGRPTPNFLLVECDGGPDHNLGHLSNHISLFALLLVGNMDNF